MIILILILVGAVVLTLSFLLVLLGNLFRIKILGDREKNRPFECGFTPEQVARLPFSLRFFLVAIVFLIFDVELLLIFPIIRRLISGILIINQEILFRFLVLLVLGLYYELNQGRLN